MSQALTIILERTGRWARAWRLELARHAIASGGAAGSARRSKATPSREQDVARLIETRSLPETLDALRDAPHSFLALELTERNPDGIRHLLTSVDEQYPRARACVLLEESMHSYEWLARELGAIHVVDSTRRLAPLVEAAIRHVSRAPRPRGSIRQRIWRNLPWGD